VRVLSSSMHGHGLCAELERRVWHGRWEKGERHVGANTGTTHRATRGRGGAIKRPVQSGGGGGVILFGWCASFCRRLDEVDSAHGSSLAKCPKKKPKKKGGRGEGIQIIQAPICHSISISCSNAGEQWRAGLKPKGGREKQKDESDVHLLQRLKKSSYLLHFIFIFILFLSIF
jgi:hypothetical protein